MADPKFRNCRVCGEQFVAFFYNELACSPVCKRIHRRASQRAWKRSIAGRLSRKASRKRSRNKMPDLGDF